MSDFRQKPLFEGPLSAKGTRMGRVAQPIVSWENGKTSPSSKQGRKLIAFGWYGGKFNHLAWLLPLLPDCRHYCEPFAGSAAVLLNRAPSPVETYDDLDGEVVNFLALRKNLGQPPFYRDFSPGRRGADRSPGVPTITQRQYWRAVRRLPPISESGLSPRGPEPPNRLAAARRSVGAATPRERPDQ